MKIGIIIGSIRDGRKGTEVAAWVSERASARGDEGVTYEVIDLKTFDLPLLTTGTVPARGDRQYDDPRVSAWSAAIDACDAFVFVTPEYNHGVPGAFKNAHDSLGPEWVRKPVAFTSYGAESGVRAVENWRTIVANFQQFGVRAQVSFSTFLEWDEDTFTPFERRQEEFDTMLDQLIEVTKKLA